jgi:ATP-dependent DNA helicase DinG
VPDVPAVPGRVDLESDVAAALSPGGPLARALPSFETRPAQSTLASAASRVFERGGVLLAEAGTGTGKTLAYLVPAILSRRRVLVSTGTKNLQEQVYFKDIPLLQDSLGVPFKAAYMKGRGNYLCLHRFEAWKERAIVTGSEDVRFAAEIDDWRTTTETGDRAELEDLPEDAPFWSDIAASTENCIGTECPRHGDCFITRMRQRAAESDVVVVNHHLLCADAAVRQSAYGEVIPECHYAVIDEAHQLEDVATQYFGRAVSNFRVEHLARDVERTAAAAVVPDPDARDDIEEAAVRLRDRARAFFTALQFLRFDAAAGAGVESRLRLREPQLTRVAEEGQALTGAAEALEAAVALAKDVPEEVLSLGRRARELREDLAFLLRADDGDYVYFLEVRGRGTYLRASPIDVSSIVREVLVDRMDGLVLTSATLTADGSFAYARARLGITEA